jgi:hypothetical protein
MQNFLGLLALAIREEKGKDGIEKEFEGKVYVGRDAWDRGKAPARHKGRGRARGNREGQEPPIHKLLRTALIVPFRSYTLFKKMFSKGELRTSAVKNRRRTEMTSPFDCLTTLLYRRPVEHVRLSYR